MTLKEELEILRGEAIEVFTGKPMDIPCIETSDAEKLCRHPVVSVHMITYNHEPYIRQAIEGVLMQKTNFEFELVIGEDCSQDKTREICFEYQKKYSDKIRVLWWHENVSRLGGNWHRVMEHCRGEFVAFCEGDDYWTDQLKLQKQVDVMRNNGNIGLCFAQADILNDSTGEVNRWMAPRFPEGFMTGGEFFRIFGIGVTRRLLRFGPESFIMTATVMVRRHVLFEVKRSFDIFKWNLCVGDCTLWIAVSSCSDVFYLNEPVSVYRKSAVGITSRNGSRTMRDGILIRIYYCVTAFGIALTDAINRFSDVFAVCQLNAAKDMSGTVQREFLQHYLKNALTRKIFGRMRVLPAVLVMYLGVVNNFVALWCSRWIIYAPSLKSNDVKMILGAGLSSK